MELSAFESFVEFLRKNRDVQTVLVHHLSKELNATNLETLSHLLTGLSQLEELVFYEENIKDEHLLVLLPTLREHSSLRCLYFSNVALTPFTLGQLVVSNPFRRVNLCTTLSMIGLRGVEWQQDIGPFTNVLARNDVLTKMHINYVNIGDLGAIEIAKALVQNHTLEELQLVRTGIESVGGIALAEALKVNGTLRSLSLVYNKLGTAGEDALIDMLRVNETLYLLYYDNGRFEPHLRRNAAKTYARTIACRDALIVFLGMRKLRRAECGMWRDCPREMLMIVAMYAWHLRHRKPQRVEKESKTE